MDNFDKFFQKRLLDEETPETEWNTPSEAVWDRSFPHFPKPKKRRRILFFFFGLVGASTLFLWLSTNNTLNQKYQQLFESQYTSDKEPTGISTFDETKIDKASQLDIENQQYQKNQNRLLYQNEFADSVGESKVNPIRKERRSDSKKDFHLKEEIQIVSTGYKDEDVSLDRSKENFNSIDKKVLKESVKDRRIFQESLHIKELAREINDQNPQDKIDVERGEANKVSLALNEDFRTCLIVPLITLVQPNIPINIKHTGLLEVAKNEFELKRVGLKNNWSVGVSAERFLMDPFGQSELSEGFSSSSTQVLFNIPITWNYGPNGSIRTGLYAANVQVDIQGYFCDEYDANMPGLSLSRSISQRSDLSVLSINGNESKLDIRFDERISLSQGDKMELRASIPLQLRAYTFPILWNRSFGQKRLRSFVQAGLSFDFINFSIDEVSIEAFSQDGDQLIESVSLERLSAWEFGGSIYMGGGFHYDLSSKIFGEAYLKVDVTDPIFSRVGIGVHYRL